TRSARLRAGNDGPGSDPETEAIEATPSPNTTPSYDPTPSPDTTPSPGTTPASGTSALDAGAPRSTDDEWRTRRAKAIDPLLPALLKRAKRRAQDDQNTLLDSVRRHKGRPSAQQVLSDGDAARNAWAEVLRDALDRAYGAGRTAAGAS